jgi:hypothetical protein
VTALIVVVAALFAAEIGAEIVVARRRPREKRGHAMTAKTRRILTAAAVLHMTVVGYLSTHVPLRTFNILLATLVVPLVWLVWAFCRWSAHQHANRWARDIRTVQGGRPAPLPHQEAVS